MLLYRLLLSLFAAVELLRSLRRGGIRAFRDRLGYGAAPPDTPHIWLHGASNGELASARPVLKTLMRLRPDLHWIVTCNSETGLALVRGWGLPRVAPRPAPLDLAWVTARVMRRWRVSAMISLEAEIWPHRVALCPGPVLQLGARMSAGTARSWARLPGFAARVLGQLDWVSAQTPETLERLRGLGLPERAAGPVVDLKALYAPPDMQPDPTLTAAFSRAQTWLAASTHDGEEEIVLDAHLRALDTAPELRLILAPRHPRRAAEIRNLAEARGLTLAQRSAGEPPADAQVYLADTMGEMALWYGLAGRVFIGGTLTDRGGHTPYEPASFGAALIHGPDVANHAAPFARLAAASAAIRITDAKSLAKALLSLSGAASQRRMGTTATRALAQDTDLGALCEAIARRLP